MYVCLYVYMGMHKFVRVHTCISCVCVHTHTHTHAHTHTHTHTRNAGVYTYKIKVSLLEIYNETIRDLLEPKDAQTGQYLTVCMNVCMYV